MTIDGIAIVTATIGNTTGTTGIVTRRPKGYVRIA